MIYITYTSAISQHADEFELIKRLCQFEGIALSIIYSDDPRFKKYYKGGRQAILIYLDKDNPVVLYGFWEFVEFLLKTGMIRC